jgi:hypothetical protein
LTGLRTVGGHSNNLYSSLPGHPETERIVGFLAQHVPEERASAILDGRENEVDYLLSKPVADMRGNGRDTSANIEQFSREERPLSKLQQLFRVIYQVRCNLEHGQKSPNNERDVDLCRCAAPLVADVVSINL